MTLTLYTNPVSRGLMIQWYLEEVGAPPGLQEVEVDFKNKQPDLFKYNPAGKVPTIDDGGFGLGQSGAVLYYLSEKLHKAPTDLQAKARILQYIFFANTELDPVMLQTAGEAKFQDSLGTLDKVLSGGHQWVTGDDFTIADVAMGGALLFLPLMYKEANYGAYPAVEAYLARLKARPACQKNMGALFGAAPPPPAAPAKA